MISLLLPDFNINSNLFANYLEIYIILNQENQFTNSLVVACG